ncbi:MAG: TonB-dependent receptor [Candidatus Pseudobacter hemicellulosilyticus]|uniref:TonB-dependent receptor n=1 Tax=Candidatus Pseudobacter hemicellulosilyticus TaxID=3121375 RepID=A0AAJ5WUW0_9BACT|nr:MAG: TonB-dependent receptor [Pseudobacter sp.]
MRLTAILLIAGMLQAHASGYSQTVSLSEKDASLQSIFQQIRKQTGFTFFYNESLLHKAGRVSIRVKNAPLTEALDHCFRDQPLRYSIIGNTVVVKEKPAGNTAADSPEEAPLPFIKITGRVLNEQGEPLANASITIRRPQFIRATATDANGYFTLYEVQQGDMLTISFVGYQNVQVRVGEKTELVITLKPLDNKLDEVIIQGYGTTNRRTITGNIVKVNAAEIEKQPVMNPLLALAGRVPGMVVTPTSGFASGPVKMEIRGRKSINSQFTSDPLFIIDGVPLSSNEAGQRSNYTNGSSGLIQNGIVGPAMGQSPFLNINPTDIESIEVLKDADATAIYGSRGANGVVLITTKKGSPGKTQFNFSASQGLSMVTRYWDMLNTADYIKMRREALNNDGFLPTISNAPDLLVWDTTRYTDWQKELWGNTGQYTNVSASLSGGDNRTQFRLGSNYSKQTEILSNSGANQRAGLSFNLGHASINSKFKLDLTASYSYTSVDLVNIPSVINLPPNAPPIYNSKGELNFEEWNAAGLLYSYPFSSLGSPYTANTNFLTSNLILRYDILPGLQLSTSLGYNHSLANNATWTPKSVQNPVLNPTGSSFAGNTVNNNKIIEPQLNYNKSFGKARVALLLGGSYQHTRTTANGTQGTGYTNDDLIESVASAPSKNFTENFGDYKYAAGFARINVNWDGKYIVNLNGRRDGSSRFGPDRQFGNFGSAGVAWIASEENFVKNILPSWISFLKLRGSYGVTGSDAVGDYQYTSQWATVNSSTGNAYQPYNNIIPLISQHAVNPYYQWQANKKLEAALNIGFLKERFSLEIAYYRDRCDNQLTQYPLPVYTGFSSVTANWPATVQNSGWELLLSARLIDNKDFSWSVSFNSAYNDNILLEYPDLEQSPYATQYKVGSSLNTIYLLQYTGVNPLTGRRTFTDFNNDGQITGYDRIPAAGLNDKYIALNTAARFTGGFGSDFRYRNFRLGCFFSFKKQNAMNGYYSSYSPGQMNNVPSAVLKDYWQKPGDNARFARLSTYQQMNDSYFMASDGAYSDASFVRLSNLSCSYNLPRSWMDKAGIKDCSIFMHAQNVFLITNYEGLDPETPSLNTLPPAKTFTLGLTLNL